jgi:hypothetical protein
VYSVVIYIGMYIPTTFTCAITCLRDRWVSHVGDNMDSANVLGTVPTRTRPPGIHLHDAYGVGTTLRYVCSTEDGRVGVWGVQWGFSMTLRHVSGRKVRQMELPTASLS